MEKRAKLTKQIVDAAEPADRRYEIWDSGLAGFGLRVQLPILGRLPLALDFGFPINKDREQVFSFWLGFFS